MPMKLTRKEARFWQKVVLAALMSPMDMRFEAVADAAVEALRKRLAPDSLSTGPLEDDSGPVAGDFAPAPAAEPAPDAFPAIPPQVGRRHRLRNGKTTGVMDINDDVTTYAFQAEVDGQVKTWSRNGRYLRYVEQHYLDVVAVLEDEPPVIERKGVRK